jgi:DNA polymerase/3'-5' exonuclease PolX
MASKSQLFLEKAISLIVELIQIRTLQSSLLNELGKPKESTAMQFKVKSYSKWITILKDHIKKKTIINNNDDIKNIEVSEKLETKLCELLETGKLQYIEDAKNELDKLMELSKSTKINKPNTDKTTDKQSSDIITKQMKPKNIDIVDTSKIEAQPKILAEETRPSDPHGAAVFDLRYVHGIGPVSAEKLVNNGVTLEGLLKEWSTWIKKDSQNAILMPSKMSKPEEYSQKQWSVLETYKQYGILEANLKKRLEKETLNLHKLHGASLVGVKYFHDMSQKIPRPEVQRAETILKHIAKHMNKDLIVMLCGSYRRGRDKSGDIDCFITHPSIKTKEDLLSSQTNILASFVELLIKVDFIVDQLDMGQQKFMGFCKVKQPHISISNLIARRLDIRFVPYESYGSAILYFTGSKNFNTTMRQHALRKGYSLSEFGLKKTSEGKDGILIPCSTEEEVFKFLDYDYKTPEERDI